MIYLFDMSHIHLYMMYEYVWHMNIYLPDEMKIRRKKKPKNRNNIFHSWYDCLNENINF